MTWKPWSKPKRSVPHKEGTMTAIQKRIVGAMLVLCTISTFVAVGSCIWRDYSLAKQGISIEAILSDKR